MVLAPLRRAPGRDLPGPVRLLVAAAGLQSLAMSGFSTYVGIWAIQRLHASAAALGVALFLRAFSGVVTGYLGGRISDRRGRRPVIIASWLSQAVCIAAFVAVSDQVGVGLVLIVLFGPLGPPGRAAAAAYLADATDPATRPVAYSAQRSAQALAQIVGPALAAVLVAGARWGLMFGVLAAISAAAVVIAVAFVPFRAPRVAGAADDPVQPETGTPASVWHDSPYLLLLGAATGITLTVAATDRFLPIAATVDYGVPTHVWGWIAVLNPILVIAFQTGLTRRLDPVSDSLRIAVAGALAGLPFLLLVAAGGTAMVTVVVGLSTLAEMIWMPLAQSLAADLAPDDRRGAYLGAFDGAISMAFAVGPMLALELSAAAGTALVWIVFAVLAVAAAGGAIAARRRLSGRLASATEPPAPVQST